MEKTNVFAINLVKRKDRKASIISEFADKEEFQLTIVPAIEHQFGAVGLWHTICNIVKKSEKEELDYVIICQDDHTFTSQYQDISLQKTIEDAKQFQADILLGGVSWFSTCIPVGKNLNWVEKFSGLQFAVIFKKFYSKILSTDFQEGNAGDYTMSALSHQIYFIYPFISIQKDFGYSDVTAKNNAKGRVGKLFKDSDDLVKATNQVISFYKKMIYEQFEPTLLPDFDNISITTYILNSKNSQMRLPPINLQFEGRTEFDVRMIKMCENTNAEHAYWMTLIQIIQQAKADEDDVIIVCDNNHLFTEAYSKECLIRHIVEGHQLESKILCGGVEDFETAIPLTRNKFWVRAFKSSSFIVLYESVYDNILEEQICSDSSIESLYREVTSNKLLMFPFISKRTVYNEDISFRLDKIYQMAKMSDDEICS
ncbi:hypothetical protein [uncultured Cyclobacterium sp.]|uniref:hypothetical protein n=1 Tax=uncultured Cyclobacterium sp. TaxID=453820 RepID=UPI0030EE5F08